MASYADYQKEKFNNEVNMYNMGLSDSGYSESSLVSMYNTYQNRVASARQSFTDAITNYDNQITQAQIANSSALAEIAYNALQKQLELSLEAFQYKNSLTLDLIDKKLALDTEYYNRRQNIISQINTENALAEEVRQFNEKMAEEQRQFDANLAEEQRQFNANLSFQKSVTSGGNGGSGKPKETPLTDGSGNPSKSNNYRNSSAIMGKEDYYFKTGDGSEPYQPRYINDIRLENVYVTNGGFYTTTSKGNTKMTGKSIGLDSTLANKSIWVTFGKNNDIQYWVWAGVNTGYINVTAEVNKAQKK